ncbi:nitrogenase component 1 [Anaerosporobacter sp.]|uniref:nitrogenase component 1 n=1 Tax=Anaerosporobacter sp. TaxID=1872529 RepID=UPI00286EF2D5|nr:nitrogenase component 1 [Anaerosporobacter sp.]
MSKSIERSRYGCNLHGAIQTATQIQGVVPIIHATPGCGLQHDIAKKVGAVSATDIQGYEIPSSNVYEKQVIFGGTSRLREQIKNTVKIINGELFLTLSGCESEMVGDDSLSMTQEIIDQGEKAINYKAPGFKGDQYIGYQGLVDALIEKLPTLYEDVEDEAENSPIRVNILGIIPEQDIYWQGNLNEIERVLKPLGVEVNKLFGYEQSIENWRRLNKASLNIVISKWGAQAAEKLQSLYGTPYIVVENLGIGPESVEQLISVVASELNINIDVAKEFLDKERERFRYSLEQIAEYYYDYEFQKSVVIVGDESTTIRYADFLSTYLGMEIRAIVITDFVGEEKKQEPSELLKSLADEIYYKKNTREINQIIEDTKPELVLGSSLEKETAERSEAYFETISYPAYSKVILNSSDVGYEGAIRLLEDLSSLLLSR